MSTSLFSRKQSGNSGNISRCGRTVVEGHFGTLQFRYIPVLAVGFSSGQPAIPQPSPALCAPLYGTLGPAVHHCRLSRQRATSKKTSTEQGRQQHKRGVAAPGTNNKLGPEFLDYLRLPADVEHATNETGDMAPKNRIIIDTDPGESGLAAGRTLPARAMLTAPLVQASTMSWPSCWR